MRCLEESRLVSDGRIHYLFRSRKGNDNVDLIDDP